MPHLILLRHGKSEWNAKGLWTGHTDIDLIAEGRDEARAAAEAMRDIVIHRIHVSDLRRAHQTLHEVKKTLGIEHVPHTSHHALKERHYGIYTGKNKWQVKEEVGDEQFKNIRRGWDVKIPEGETLKDVYDRVAKYFDEYIAPELAAGHNVLIVAHGNSLRALAKHVEGMTEDEVCDLEIGTGEVHCYALDVNGKVTNKEIRSANTSKGKV
ncbi:MAG: 2,3-bisphosphoglycerate-dependent phosphoglycerate mutase [Patescibacteria group bacterium]|jgi:2,3-bisphosphoglycerate-dependent phosphoglycerate mutase